MFQSAVRTAQLLNVTSSSASTLPMPPPDSHSPTLSRNRTVSRLLKLHGRRQDYNRKKYWGRQTRNKDATPKCTAVDLNSEYSRGADGVPYRLKHFNVQDVRLSHIVAPNRA